MHSHSVAVLVPPAIHAPRGALWAAHAIAWVVGLIRRQREQAHVPCGLDAVGTPTDARV